MVIKMLSNSIIAHLACFINIPSRRETSKITRAQIHTLNNNNMNLLPLVWRILAQSLLGHNFVLVHYYILWPLHSAHMPIFGCHGIFLFYYFFVNSPLFSYIRLRKNIEQTEVSTFTIFFSSYRPFLWY